MKKSISRICLDTFLPDRIKRLIVICSIIGVIKDTAHINRKLKSSIGEKGAREQYLKIINDRLVLADSPNAMGFPLKLSSLWDRDVLKEHYNGISDPNDDSQLRRVSQYLYQELPVFLRYNTQSAIEDDLVALLKLDLVVGKKIWR